MADEITLSAKLAFSKSGVEDSFEALGQQFDMAGTEYIKNIQAIATSETALQKGSITTPGLFIVKNLDSTNFVNFRGSSGGANCVKVKAGEVQVFRFSGTAPYAIADTAEVRIQYLLLED